MSDRVRFINVADLLDKDDPNGRTYRQVSHAKEHSVALGSLVELEAGARLFVVNHSRDCDGTPLYSLSVDATDTEQRYPGFRNPGWVSGYDRHAFEVIRKPEGGLGACPQQEEEKA